MQAGTAHVADDLDQFQARRGGTGGLSTGGWRSTGLQAASAAPRLSEEQSRRLRPQTLVDALHAGMHQADTGRPDVPGGQFGTNLGEFCSCLGRIDRRELRQCPLGVTAPCGKAGFDEFHLPPQLFRNLGRCRGRDAQRPALARHSRRPEARRT